MRVALDRHQWDVLDRAAREVGIVQACDDGAGGALPLFEQRDRVHGGATGAGEGIGFGDPAVETVFSSALWGRLDPEPDGAARKAALQLACPGAILECPWALLVDDLARLWLRSLNSDLDWRKPLELIAEGEYRRVIGAVLAMAEGVTA